MFKASKCKFNTKPKIPIPIPNKASVAIKRFTSLGKNLICAMKDIQELLSSPWLFPKKAALKRCGFKDKKFTYLYFPFVFRLKIFFC
jgi:hypothetical protein